MSQFVSFQRKWIYEHAFFIYHGFMSMFSCIIFYPLIHKINLYMWQIVPYDNVWICHFVASSFGTFILHISQFVSHTIKCFLWCQQRAKFGGPYVWHPQWIQKQKQMCNDILSSSFWNPQWIQKQKQMCNDILSSSFWNPQWIQKQKQMCNDILSSSFWNARAWRHSTFSLNFLFEVKDVKTSTNFSSVLGDHLMDCKLLLCCLCGISKTNKNVNCVAEPQESQALLYILSISNSSWI